MEKSSTSDRRYQRYMLAMAKLTFWTFVVGLIAWFFSHYLDTPVPDEIPEKLKVKFIDASMRTYKHVIDTLVSLGITTYFSPLDRKISDWFILTQMTGQPWGMSLTADQTLKIIDTMIAGVRVLIYQPVSTYKLEDRPVLIFFHGGGWSTLSVDCYDPLIRKIAKESGVVIISVNYRLSPEHPYPKPLKDCLHVVEYVLNHHEQFRIDPMRVAVGGDSAGGNMAASIALKHGYKLSLQILIVPVLQIFNFKTTSVIENSEYFHDSINSPKSLVFITNYLGLSPDYMNDFLDNNHTSSGLKRSYFASYVDQKMWMRSSMVRNKQLLELPNQVDCGNQVLSSKIEHLITDPYVAPLMAKDVMLKRVPEAYIVTCGYDVIRDDGVMFAERLKSIGNKVTHKHYDAGFHHAWFFPHGPLKIKIAERIVSDLVTMLSDKL